jgi:hypothetical protein
VPPPQSPRSPTEIDPKLQAQAWALLPDLAKGLRNIITLRQRPETDTVGRGEEPPSIRILTRPARTQETEPGIPVKMRCSKACFFNPEFQRAKKENQCRWRRAFKAIRLQRATPRLLPHSGPRQFKIWTLRMGGSQPRRIAGRNKNQRRGSFKAHINQGTSQRVLHSSRARWKAGVLIVFPQTI